MTKISEFSFSANYDSPVDFAACMFQVQSAKIKKLKTSESLSDSIQKTPIYALLFSTESSLSQDIKNFSNAQILEGLIFLDWDVVSPSMRIPDAIAWVWEYTILYFGPEIGRFATLTEPMGLVVSTELSRPMPVN